MEGIRDGQVDILKKKACSYIDGIAEHLCSISQELFEHPELSFEEYEASRLLAEELEKAEFSVELGVAGLETAIRAVHPKESDGPTVALLAEYDALPEIGHACGHNLIAAASLGAALALGSIKEELPGKLLFFGTPGEESKGGKVPMVKAGLFDGIDAAMMFHPSDYTTVTERSQAITEVKIEFAGKPAHAAGSPEKGVNTLDAVIQTFNGINAMRQHIKDKARIHGIITDGGALPNIVPEHAAASFYVRAMDDEYCNVLMGKLHRCAEGASLATGAKLSFKITAHNKPMNPNRMLGEVLARALQELEVSLDTPPENAGMGSTDLGDVSQVVPTIEGDIKFCAAGVPAHSREFAEAANSEHGRAVMIIAAKALAMTAIEVFIHPLMYTPLNLVFTLRCELIIRFAFLKLFLYTLQKQGICKQ